MEPRSENPKSDENPEIASTGGHALSRDMTLILICGPTREYLGPVVFPAYMGGNISDGMSGEYR